MTDVRISENYIHLAGDLVRGQVPDLWKKYKKEMKGKDTAAIDFIDLAGVNDIDSAGIAFIYEMMDALSHGGKSIQLIQTPDRIVSALDAFRSESIEKKTLTHRNSFLENVGERTLEVTSVLKDFMILAADILYFSVLNLFDKKGQREGSFIQQSVFIGVSALPIVGLISFLIGFILALQSAAQLRQFGANIFVADLIGIAMLREMGPIMTAIVVAGRSGSSIASEIATMQVTEELDALKSMALNPIRYVIAPKLQGITLTMPLLTIMADLIGILGGFVIGVTYLGLSPSAFFNELITVLLMKDVITGLIKSVLFAWIIVIVASHYGLHVTGGAEGVGRATTASVVASIFMVIVADSILGLLFYFNEPVF
ncbi:MlaE family lipid ABC transporter permease subunit [candidate division KSB1 bacterium]|nr:MlaE family lipid ABC transporter permease subunit [candidate division KSB1 bacterium]